MSTVEPTPPGPPLGPPSSPAVPSRAPIEPASAVPVAPARPSPVASPSGSGYTPALRPRTAPADDLFYDPAYSHLPELELSHLAEPGERRLFLPLSLLVATCLSTFWVGCTHWDPLRLEYLANWQSVAGTVMANWRTGLTYMAAIIGILMTHEMGHFLFTLRYRVPSSYPMFIPVPFNPIGTMGAVIGMDGMRANRRQIFDIGVAGPLAGLLVAVPVLWYGIKQLDLGVSPPTENDVQFYLPVLGQWMLHWTHPQAAWAGEKWVSLGQLNPYFMAGWVGMLITGLNMLPISQLDGGHVIYALFRRKAHTLARLFISFAIFYVVAHLDEAVLWSPMLLLVIFLGIHHPPTANDRVPLGPVRWAIGLASLTIPFLCFPLLGLKQ